MHYLAACRILNLAWKGPNLAVLIWELRVSGVTAYKLTISLRKLKLAEDCFHNSPKTRAKTCQARLYYAYTCFV